MKMVAKGLYVAVGLVLGLVGSLVANPLAQTPAQLNAAPPQPVPPELAARSEFEIHVFTRNGEAEVRCVRGCRLMWAPTAPQQDMLIPSTKLDGVVTDQGCIYRRRCCR